MIGHILGLAAPIIDQFVEDKDAKANIKAKLESELIALDAAQAQANTHPFLSQVQGQLSCGFVPWV